MGWTTPRDFVAGEVITASICNTHIRDNLRYLKGLDGVVTIGDGLTIDNSGGDERLLLPLLSTAECATVLNAAGEVAYDEATNRIKMYGATLNSVVTTADVDDTPVDSATTDPISSNWAYDLVAGMGDIFINAGGMSSARAYTTHNQYLVIPMVAADYIRLNIKIPALFITLTSCKVLFIPTTTGTYEWTAYANFAAEGEDESTHSDNATASGVACTDDIISSTDISAALTGIAAGDYVGIGYTINALTTTTAINVIGLLLRYT